MAGRKKLTPTHTSFDALDGNGDVSALLQQSGMTETQLDQMNRTQLENLANGLSNNRDQIDEVEREGFADGRTGDLNPLLTVGYSRKLPEVKARNPEKVHLFWATLTGPVTVHQLLARGCAYAKAEDLRGGFASVANLSDESTYIRIQEMVLLKTKKEFWEQAMHKYHVELPAASQQEIYSANKNANLDGGFDNKAVSDDVVYNPNRVGSMYGSAAALLTTKKPGMWSHISE